jgi:hypothetical protein
MRRVERGAARRRIFPARKASSRNILIARRWSVDAWAQLQGCARAMSRDHLHKLARNHKQQALKLWFSRFEAMMRRAGWVARRRPLAGPLSPCGSQPAPQTLPGGSVFPNGSAGLTAEYASRGTKVPLSLVAPITGEAATGHLTGLRRCPPFQPTAMSSRPMTGSPEVLRTNQLHLLPDLSNAQALVVGTSSMEVVCGILQQ